MLAPLLLSGQAFRNAAAPARPRGSGFASTARPNRGAPQDQTPDADTVPGDHVNEFLRLLAMLYQIRPISPEIAAELEGFSLDTTKPLPTDHNGTLHAVFGDVPVQFTKNSILTDEPMTPEIAYRMAIAASLNPQFGTLSLSGNPEERAMLFMAAKTLGIKVDMETAPRDRQDIESAASKFSDFERRIGIAVEDSVVPSCLPAAKKGWSLPSFRFSRPLVHA